MGTDLAGISKALASFSKERDWEKFHSPKNLAIALSVEAAELLEHFQWVPEKESGKPPREKLSAIEDEVADVQIYLLMLTEKLGIDLTRAVEAKIEKNRLRYPADQVRGSTVRPDRKGFE